MADEDTRPYRVSFRSFSVPAELLRAPSSSGLDIIKQDIMKRAQEAAARLGVPNPLFLWEGHPDQNGYLVRCMVREGWLPPNLNSDINLNASMVICPDDVAPAQDQ